MEEEETAKPSGGGGGGGGEEGEEDVERQDTSVTVEEQDVERIVACLEDVHRLLAQPQHLIVSLMLYPSL
jgi:hypothetical protein